MQKIKVSRLYKSFGDNELFKDINFEIGENEIIGIVGNNGSGKSTLANILSSNENYDKGSVEYSSNISIGYLKQSTLYSCSDLENTYNGNFSNQFIKSGGELDILGISDINNERLANLSGGEKTKIILADIWSQKNNVLILDEPTNYMDIDGIKWLVQEIKKFKGIVIVISHDRYFLDEVVTGILEIEKSKITKFYGNYTDYKKEKEHRYNSQLNMYENEIKKQNKIDEQIEKFKNWSEKGHRDSKTAGLNKSGVKFGLKEKNRARVKKRDKQVKSKIAMLEKSKSDMPNRPENDESINFNFNGDIEVYKKNTRIVTAENIKKIFGNYVVFNESSFFINKFDKIGIIGKNGTGKSTLIKIILGIEPITSGEIFVSKNINIEYLSQEILDEDKGATTLTLLKRFDKNKQTQARTTLANMGLNSGILNRKINVLSLGQRMRIKLALISISNVDVLILDEPTNHLDINTKEQLEEAIKNFKGTVILVSHDRYLLSSITNKLLIFDGNNIRRVEEGYDEYFKKDKKVKRDKFLLEFEKTKILSKLGKKNITEEEYNELNKKYDEVIKLLNEVD